MQSAFVVDGKLYATKFAAELALTHQRTLERAALKGIDYLEAAAELEQEREQARRELSERIEKHKDARAAFIARKAAQAPDNARRELSQALYNSLSTRVRNTLRSIGIVDMEGVALYLSRYRRFNYIIGIGPIQSAELELRVLQYFL